MVKMVEDKIVSVQTLEEKTVKSIGIICDAERIYGKNKVWIAWTGGKDSGILLHLVKTAYDGKIPFKVLNIDTSLKFKEIYDFRDRMVREWDLDLVILTNEAAAKIVKTSRGAEDCCYNLKIKMLNHGIRKYGIKALMTGIRWDEQRARANEKYFSEREDHIRVNPILHFTENDIWEYIRGNNVSYCTLYDKGYRSLGCVPCTTPNFFEGPERGGRDQDKEAFMYRLRSRGYF